MEKKRKIEIYDTTLRDGAQMSGISFSSDDKLAVISVLDGFGVDFIEAGWPGANPTDEEVFRKLSASKLRNAEVAAFTMTCRKGKEPEDDQNLANVLLSGAGIITLFGKSSLGHVLRVLGVSPEENLKIIEKTCLFFRRTGKRVFYDAEHFFDGYRENRQYALDTLAAAVSGGAERIILCDTNGGTFPDEIRAAIRSVREKTTAPLGIHCHNDSGLAIACSLAAVEEGVVQVQGTINGYGERCGNADLCVAIPDLQIRMGFDCLPSGQIKRIAEVSRFVAEIANQRPDPCQPFVGSNAFAHVAGTHVDAARKMRNSYEHIDPGLVGNRSRITVSQLAGKSNIRAVAETLGISLTPSQIELALGRVKELEKSGFQFEGAQASVELLLRRVQDGCAKAIEVLCFNVAVGNRYGRNVSEAIVKVRINGNDFKEVSEGNGPVNALDLALRKAALRHYPFLAQVHLTDYKVRILNGKDGTDAKVRVLIEFNDGAVGWTTVGCSANIVEASLIALVDGFEYAILKNKPTI